MGCKVMRVKDSLSLLVHLFTFWGQEAPPSMQSDGMQSDESEGHSLLAE